MDIEQIRKRLQSLQNATTKQSNLWKPEPGKNLIRLVPYKFNRENPFIELYFHYEIGKKSILSPVSFGEPDPIVEFSEKLKRQGNREDWLMGRKLEPKLRAFAPMVVRGEEETGVRFWGFGKTVYQELLSICDDPDYLDISHETTGNDITVTFKTAEEVGKTFPETKIRVKPAKTVLTDNEELMSKLLENQKDILEVYTKPTYDELKEILSKWLNPEEEEEEGNPQKPDPKPAEEEDEEESKEESKKPPTKKKRPVAEGNEDVAAEFDNLFARGESAKK